jgi:hypothetical protein
MKCLVCKEETQKPQDRYCSEHGRAYEDLHQAFTKWATGYGTLTIPEFLERIGKRPETGEKTREIIQFLRENPSRWT